MFRDTRGLVVATLWEMMGAVSGLEIEVVMVVPSASSWTVPEKEVRQLDICLDDVCDLRGRLESYMVECTYRHHRMGLLE